MIFFNFVNGSLFGCTICFVFSCQVVGLLPERMLLQVIKELMEHAIPNIQRKSMELLNSFLLQKEHTMVRLITIATLCQSSVNCFLLQKVHIWYVLSAYNACIIKTILFQWKFQFWYHLSISSFKPLYYQNFGFMSDILL
jgi:hypothetical protein